MTKFYPPLSRNDLNRLYGKPGKMKATTGIRSIIDQAERAGALVQETSVTVMISRIGATYWNEFDRVMIFADGTATKISSIGTNRQLGSHQAIREVIGL
jgi:hypothetical protein